MLTPFIYIVMLSPSCDARESQPPVTKSPKTFGLGSALYYILEAFVVVASL